jgi:hypothetical protein
MPALTDEKVKGYSYRCEDHVLLRRNACCNLVPCTPRPVTYGELGDLDVSPVACGIFWRFERTEAVAAALGPAYSTIKVAKQAALQQAEACILVDLIQYTADYSKYLDNTTNLQGRKGFEGGCNKISKRAHDNEGT